MTNMSDVFANKVGVGAVAQEKIKKGEITPDGKVRVKVQDVVNFKDQGLSVEEARKRMLEAGQAPKGIAAERKKNDAVGAVAPKPASETPAQVTEVPPEPKAPEVAASPANTTVVQPEPAERGTGGSQPAVDAADSKAERVENDRFIVEIKQERGEWAATITFKNGAGTERFTARTKNELMLKLAEGKGNATLRVRAAVRREKFGTSQFDQSYTLPDGMSEDEFKALPESARQHIMNTTQVQQALLFRDSTPDFYPTNNNQDKILSFLETRNLPITAKNLLLAFEDLMEDDLLDRKPQTNSVSVPVTPVPTPAPKSEDSPSVAVPTPAAPAAVAVPAPAAVTVRTRGTSGLQPGQSSAVNEELETREVKPTGPSADELRRSVPIGQPLKGSALEAAYRKEMAERAKNRQRY